MTSTRRTMLGLALVAGALAPALGCNTDDGRTLAPVAPGATAPPLPTSSTTAGAVLGAPPVGSGDSAGVGAMTLTSPAFVAGTPIPDRFACQGALTPPFAWAGVPEGTVELALVMIDLDANGFVHWIVSGLSPTLTGVDEGALPEGAVEARNDSSEFGFFGPCPPDGETHRYELSLYALSAASGIAEGAGAPEAITAIDGVAIATTAIIGTYH